MSIGSSEIQGDRLAVGRMRKKGEEACCRTTLDLTVKPQATVPPPRSLRQTKGIEGETGILFTVLANPSPRSSG